jgi:hypothetical protein
MSAKALILIASIIAYTVMNAYFMRTDETFRNQAYARKFMEDPLGIQRFKQQPFKMSLLTAILLGPVSLYLLIQTFSAG